MRFFSTLTLAAAAFSAGCSALPLETRDSLPDSIKVPVKNLYPEDGVWNFDTKQLIQSNLWKGRLSVYKPSDNSHFNVLIPGVSSSGDGSQQMAGVSLDKRTNAKRLFAVAKPSDAFRFDGTVHDQGPCSFHAFNLPLSSSSTPAWSVDLRGVQSAFQQKYGTRPYGNVASAQDNDGNSYVIFALGAPAIAKVSPDGKTVEPWFFEKSNGSQRPGYTGVAFIPEENAIAAFGGPRPITLFRLSDSTPTARTVKINGNFGSLDGTEKVKAIPGNDGKTKLIGAKAPNVYSFTSTDGWNSASFKTFSRKGFEVNSLTTVFEYGTTSARGIYGAGAYFDTANGGKGGRTSFPAYRISQDLLA